MDGWDGFISLLCLVLDDQVLGMVNLFLARPLQLQLRSCGGTGAWEDEASAGGKHRRLELQPQVCPGRNLKEKAQWEAAHLFIHIITF